MNPEFAASGTELGVPFYQDYKEMLRWKKIDAVIVAVPPHVHAEVGVACMEHGVHVLMEKPIADTLEDADKLIEAAARYGVILEIGHMYRFDKGIEMAKAKLDNDEIGQLIGFHIFSTYLKSPGYFKQEWRTKRDTGGGPLLTNGIHDIDRLRYVCGDVEAVSAFMSNKTRGFEVEDSMSISVKCKNGAVGTIFLSDCSHRALPYTDIYFGTKSSMMINSSSYYIDDPLHEFEQISWDYGSNRRIDRVELKREDNHLKELRHYCQVLQGQASPRTTGEEGRKTLQTLMAIQEAMLTQRVVAI
ncbi:MAG: oxidoreductase domain protein [Paenibacillus sp.]|nr:oxidoreductase domain protein [Paenibacillus sp.]